MTLDWLPKWLAARKLKDAHRAGSMSLGQAETILKSQAEPLAADFRAQVAQGLWSDQDFVAALTQAERQHALWLRQVQRYVGLHDGAFDLPLAYPDAWTAGTAPLLYGELEAVRAFFNTSAIDLKSAFWMAAGLDEAQLHMLDAHIAALRQAARAAWQPILDGLRQEAAAQPVEAYLALLDLLHTLGDYEGFLSAYEDFRRTHPAAGAAIFPWRANLAAFDDPAWAPHLKQFRRLLRQLITIRSLQHRQNEPDLGLLAEILLELEPATAGIEPGKPGEVEGKDRGLPMPAANLPTPNPFGFALPPPPRLAAVRDGLRKLRAGLAGGDQLAARRAALLGLWQAFAERHGFDLAAAAATLEPLPPGGEAFGVLRQTLAGEIATYAGAYEDAQLAFAAALAIAGELLGRPGVAEKQLGAARRFIGMAGQWRGNALFYLADYAAASECYAALEAYLAPDDREVRLLHALNRGNLAFLRNNLADHRGYITYEKSEQALLKDGGTPEPFLRLKYDRHRLALVEAGEQYAAAAALVDGLPVPDQKAYRPLIEANQANIWWMQANLQREAGYFSPALAKALADLGESEELYRRALAAMQSAQAAAMAAPIPNLALAASLRASTAELHLLLGEAGQSLADAAECLRLLDVDPAADAGAALRQTAARGLAFPEAGWRVFLTQARAYDTLGQAEQAGQAYARALAIVGALRQQIRAADWQASAAQDKFQVFECAMHFHYATDRDSAAMFDLAEQSRSYSFLELLESSRINIEGSLDQDLRRQRDLLAAEFASRNNAIRQAAAYADNAELDRLLAGQRELVNRWSLLQSQISQDLADEMERISPAPLRWAAFQEWLRASQPDTVLLSFMLGSEWSYLLVGDAQGLDSYELKGRAAIEFAVSRLLWYAQKGPAKWADFVAANRDAVGLLFGPALAGGLLERLRGKRIVIVPDGILYYLPFELLLIEAPRQADGAPLDPATYAKTSKRNDLQICADLLPFYMVNLGAVSVAQSASVWRMVQEQRPAEPSALALGVYDINYKTAALPTGPGHARAQELLIAYGDLSQTRAAAAVLKAMERDGTTVLALSAWDDQRAPWPADKQSNEDNFKRLLGEHGVRYLLFAGHGVFNDKYPNFSGMVFNLAAPGGEAPPDGAAQQDGFFGLNDIFNLRMPATELTFLAACQGGLGLISRGEGVNALTRALMYRGSPSVVASLWSVDVLATMDLVAEFFGRLQADPDADKAALLGAARLAVARNPKKPHFAHPFYWAPFVLMGKR
ncbi:MAG TPA: CHAT domain-containing protein [Herpetosiphonaceae bacterium]|nr:CHAT domain-containing protein [Herpetosiphonaceae bacterium]